MRIFPRLFSENRPNLLYRKSKITGQNIEQLLVARIPVPKFKEEALFGIFPVLEGLEAGKRRFHKLYIKDSFRERAKEDPRISRVLQLADEKNIPINRITQAQLDRLTDFQLHNGICLDASPLPFASLSSCRLSVYLDGVLDPGNIGAIARSSQFFGVGQLIYCKGRGPLLITPSMSKASCGAIEHIGVALIENINELLQEFPDSLFIGTSDPISANRYKKEIIKLEDLSLPENKRIVLLLGDEYEGISPKIMAYCNQLTTISGFLPNKSHVSSLNVSVVAGILLQALSHKLKL